MTQLTDFTSKELNFLYLTLEDKLKDINNKLEIVESFDSAEIKYNIYTDLVEKHDMCTQWMTKIDEASLIVKAEEIIKYS